MKWLGKMNMKRHGNLELYICLFRWKRKHSSLSNILCYGAALSYLSAFEEMREKGTHTQTREIFIKLSLNIVHFSFDIFVVCWLACSLACMRACVFDMSRSVCVLGWIQCKYHIACKNHTRYSMCQRRTINQSSSKNRTIVKKMAHTHLYISRRSK